MVIETVLLERVEKPWGRNELAPWGTASPDKSPIGELWFQRTGETASDPSLLLKLLFTSQPLSIQVHPNDVLARSLGLKNGKTEAWYILSADPGSKLALGTTRTLTAQQLRDAIRDGSIADLVDWREVEKDDVIFVPAGTIHALGPGLVVAEVQQRSDTTFRLFDFGRGRDLDVDRAADAADLGSSGQQAIPNRLTDLRTLLIASKYFSIELVNLPAFSDYEFVAENETWIFGLQGSATFGALSLQTGSAIFVQRELLSITIGAEGCKCLVAYAASRPSFDLLRDTDAQANGSALTEFQHQTSVYEAANRWAVSAGDEA